MTNNKKDQKIQLDDRETEKGSQLQSEEMKEAQGNENDKDK
ncbi:hypothetical protein [Oceanobacillus polygoni]|uniref:Uncharacterized protein n=1 Tax=Oceanobacillus polygoni TaxID=1235259 RepID=A0A9X0YNR7_9BACI|nr:hypothetical protein [Oceanobacillus polygoni]MBP2076185.1 hypothetical protein [Oceanobacillus polygoni]